MVNDGGTLYSGRRGCDSDVGCSRDRCNRGYSNTVFHGNLHRLQASKEERFEEKEVETEDAAVVSREEDSKGGCEIVGIGHVPERFQRRWFPRKGCHSLTLSTIPCILRANESGNVGEFYRTSSSSRKEVVSR